MDRPGIGVGVLIVRDGKLLLRKRVRSHGEGTWSLAGGHLEYGETPERCAIRETLEETGLTIASGTVVALTTDIFEPEGKHYVTIWVKAEGIGEGDIVLDPTEASDYGWFPLDALPSPLFPPLENLLNGGSMIPFDPLSLA